jgi:hypothetical protein
MQYKKVVTPTREALIALEITKSGAPYQALFGQTDASGYEVWLAESDNGFNNDFQNAGEQRYINNFQKSVKQRYEEGWWGEIFRDVVRPHGGTDNRGRLNVDYVSQEGTEWEKTHTVWMPSTGLWVPTKDGVFVPGTLVPFETIHDKQEAINRFDNAGLPRKYVSYFYRPDRYNKADSRGNFHRFISRAFVPCWLDDDRFSIDANRLPFDLGGAWIGSRPAYGKPEVVEEVATSAGKK